MAKRDITEIVKLVPDGYLPPAYELNSDDLTFLYRKAQEPDGLFKVIGMCVAYGYVMGHRATINGTYKEAHGKRGKRNEQNCKCKAGNDF